MAQDFQARFLQTGDRIDYTPVTAVSAGEVVVVGVSQIGYASEDIAAGVKGSLQVTGTGSVVKVTGAITVGSALYWDETGDPLGGTAGTGALTTVSGGNTFFGISSLAAGGADELVTVRMVDVASITNTVHNDLTNIIADPGDGLAIPITASGTCPLTTAAAETRTLAAPTNIGQLLQLCMAVRVVGDAVVTAAAAINTGGDTIMTFGVAGDNITLIATDIAGSPVWRVLGNDGVALS